MPATHPGRPELSPHRYALMSAWIKSMRLSRPADALYYFELLALVPEVPPSQLIRRIFCHAAEDSMSPWVLTDALQLWNDRHDYGDLTYEERQRKLVYAIATGPNSYNSGAYGLLYDWTDMPETGPRLDMAAVRKRLLRTNPLPDLRQEWLRVWSLFLRALDVLETPEVYALAAKYITQCAARPANAFQLEPLAQAFTQELGSLAKMDPTFGWNWLTRTLFIATVGPVDAPSPDAAMVKFPAIWEKAKATVKGDLREKEIRIPTFAYDGKHCWRRGKIWDERFAGTKRGVVNMFAMARRDGGLFADRQAVVPKLQVPDWFLKRPFVRTRL